MTLFRPKPEEKTIYLIFGVPCAGKSWVCEQLPPEDFYYISHDSQDGHSQILTKAIYANMHRLAIDCPFNERALYTQLSNYFPNIEPLAIVASQDTIKERYLKRNPNKPVPKNILTRANSILDKVEEWGCWSGSSEEALTYLLKQGDSNNGN